jgi:hypothetical protein
VFGVEQLNRRDARKFSIWGKVYMVSSLRFRV